MLEISDVEIAGWRAALRGMRNPKNSWERGDSKFDVREYEYPDDLVPISVEPISMGPNDLTLANTLADGGPVHAKYRRMIVVWLDINAPLYWWKEFDTYKVGTVANSCSTMHKIHAKPFTQSDFSTEHLLSMYDCKLGDFEGPVNDIQTDDVHSTIFSPKGWMNGTIDLLNESRGVYLHHISKPTKDLVKHKQVAKTLWWQMIQLLPSCYNQKRTVMLSYEVLANIYRWRRNHKLDEWHTFCDWIESLPYSELITGKR